MSTSNKPLHVVFLHLDLGIGGAEQLVLQLATASQELAHKVDIVTTRCDADHCFDVVKPPYGRLANDVHVWGNWIPANVLGVGTALFSNLRMMYLAFCVSQDLASQADLIVVDVLPIPLPFLRNTKASLLFYCHYPDKLLVRNYNASVEAAVPSSIYRRVMDALEEWALPMADSLLVNSNFTKKTVQDVFPSTRSRDLQVLYPALDTDIKPTADSDPLSSSTTTTPLIVSLNRYERKKNVELVLYAYSQICHTHPNVKVVIAGGYDTKNIENVEYRGELETIKNNLGLTSNQVEFRMSISDQERATLLQTALCVVYTPAGEHFGIVPLEVMYAGTPVIACNSGGPLETVLDGRTGFLCEPTPQAFGCAIQTLLEDPQRAREMGIAGRKHVIQRFGKDRLRQEWNTMTKEAIQQRRRRRRTQTPSIARLALELCGAFLFVLLLTFVLRKTGRIQPHESVLGAFRRHITGNEL